MNAEVLSGTVLGTCTLQKVIGRGGMGAVFLAQQSRPRRQVAVKVLLPMSRLQPSQQAAFLERFRRETDTAASLDHPNILPVHEYGERDGLAYLVMPYISGGTLRDELEAEGKLPFTRIVSYLDQTAAALDFAHERGIIHRDIKPANLLMTPEKRLMLTDFGLVKIITGGQQTQSPLSETGMPMGTPDYMAPEQVLGGEIDTRADIYSLGIILYQMVTGNVPFKGEMPMKVAIQHLNTLPPQPRNFRPDLPAQAEQVILRALAKRPADRYMFAHDLANAFRQALEAAGVQVGDRMTGLANDDDHAENRSRGLFNPIWQDRVITSENILEEAIDTPDFPHIPSSGPVPTGQAMDALRDMIDRKSALPDTSKPASTPPPAPTHIHPTGTRLAKKLLIAHSEQDKGTRDTQEDMKRTIPPMPNKTQRPFASTRNTPAPIIQTTNNTRQESFIPDQHTLAAPTNDANAQRTKEASWPTSTNSTQSPQEMRSGQKTYDLPQDQSRQDTNQAPQIFQFSPSGPVPSHDSGLHDATTPVQTVYSNDASQGGQWGAASTPFNNERNSLNTRNTGTKPLMPGGSQIGSKGLIAGRPGTMALSLSENQQARVTKQLGQDTNMLPVSRATGTLQHPVGEYSGDTGMLRLHQPVKVVKVPVAGQPGQYMTGILPVLPQPQTAPLLPPAPTQQTRTALKDKAKQYSKIIILVAIVLIVLFTSGVYALTRPAAPHAIIAKRSVGTVSANNPNATATAGVSATATAEETNLILDDPLNENFHNWRQGNIQGQHYEFKDGAYHIRSDDNLLTLAAQFNLPVSTKYSYSLTMQPVAGNQDSPFNYYGMMLRYSVDNSQTPTFYFFSIINNKDQSKYQFRRYNGHKPKDQSPWVATPFEHNVGNELHKGNQPNTVKVIVDGNHFTFVVNGKQIGDAHDDAYKETGAIGMGVNQKGSEVAFTNFRLVRLQ